MHKRKPFRPRFSTRYSLERTNLIKISNLTIPEGSLHYHCAYFFSYNSVFKWMHLISNNGQQRIGWSIVRSQTRSLLGWTGLNWKPPCNCLQCSLPRFVVIIIIIIKFICFQRTFLISFRPIPPDDILVKRFFAQESAATFWKTMSWEMRPPFLFFRSENP